VQTALDLIVFADYRELAIESIASEEARVHNLAGRRV
jgi:hypothetical protein